MKRLHPIAKYVTQYFYSYLQMQRGYSENTLLAYRDSLKLLFCYVSDKLNKNVEELNFEDINDRNVTDFLDYLEIKRHVSPKTRNARLMAIKSFSSYVAWEEPTLLECCQRLNSIPNMRVQKSAIAYLDSSELKELLDCIGTDSPLGMRDKAILLLMFNSGARAQETANLTTDDIHYGGSAYVRILGKGNKFRTCPLWDETTAAIKNYLQCRRNKSSPFLFLNMKGDQLTRFGIRYIIKKYVKFVSEDSSIHGKNIGPHSIRHGTAMNLLKAGNDVNMVSIWLGHVNINTTHQYLEIDLEMKRDLLKKANTLADHDGGSPPVWRQDKVLSYLDSVAKRNMP